MNSTCHLQQGLTVVGFVVVTSRWMLRAAAAPELFLDRGFGKFLSGLSPTRKSTTASKAKSKKTTSSKTSKPLIDLGLVLPPDLTKFLSVVGANGGRIAGFKARLTLPKLGVLIASKQQKNTSSLLALLANAVPFGELSKTGELLLYFVTDAPTHGVIAALDAKGRARLICRGAAELAVIRTMELLGQELDLPPFGLADEEAIKAQLERARLLVHLLRSSDTQVRTATRALALKPLDVPPPSERDGLGKKAQKPSPRLAPPAFGPLIEAFFRDDDTELEARLLSHADSSDRIVREAVEVIETKNKLSSELARRRAVAQKAIAQAAKQTAISPDQALGLTKRIVDRIDALPPNAESFATIQEREETLLALRKLGHKTIIPTLLERALSNDPIAVDMLSAMRDRSLVPHLDALLGGSPAQRTRAFEVAVARMLATIDAKESRDVLRRLLEANPMSNWREGLERNVLVRELIIALGELEDPEASSLLIGILESTSQEYRAVLPATAFALGKLHSARALTTLENRLLFSPKEPVTCEAVWAVGAIGQADLDECDHAKLLLERLSNLEPGAEVTRLTGLAKIGVKIDSGELRSAIDHALWDPAFRQEETSRRRAWGLRALEELAYIPRMEGAPFFLGHDAIRHFVTRDDQRVRQAAERAFGAWKLPVPKVRYYFGFSIRDLERHGGLDALHEAVRDPLGVFRHNIATRLAEIGDPKSIRPLAEATARLFGEPPTSTYEYDDAPPQLVAFVRALAKLNLPEGNEVLIEGLRSDNHQVRAVVAENAPDDERFVPELMSMLEDPRSFLRSRAEKSLTSLGAIQSQEPPLPATTEVAVVRRVEG